MSQKMDLILKSILLWMSGLMLSVAAETPPIEATAPTLPPLEFWGQVVQVPLEGGFYGIEGQDGNKYLPLNLPEMFKKEALQVQVKAEKATGTLGIQMWGHYIRLLSISAPCLTQNLSDNKVPTLK